MGNLRGGCEQGTHNIYKDLVNVITLIEYFFISICRNQ